MAEPGSTHDSGSWSGGLCCLRSAASHPVPGCDPLRKTSGGPTTQAGRPTPAISTPQINKANVSSLESPGPIPTAKPASTRSWRAASSTAAAATARSIALDAEDRQGNLGPRGHAGMTAAASITGRARTADRRLIFAMNDYLQEIDATTGKSIYAPSAMTASSTCAKDLAAIRPPSAACSRARPGGVREPHPPRFGAGRGLHVAARAICAPST